VHLSATSETRERYEGEEAMGCAQLTQTILPFGKPPPMNADLLDEPNVCTSLWSAGTSAKSTLIPLSAGGTYEILMTPLQALFVDNVFSILLGTKKCSRGKTSTA